MNFNLYKTNDTNKLAKIAKKRAKLFAKKEDVDLYHINKLNNNQTHVVFYISDEYQFGTKNSGEQLKVPFDNYVNIFIFSNSPYLLIESINDKYTDLIKAYVEKHTKCIMDKSLLSNDKIINIQKELNGYIKEFEYSFDEESFIESNISNDRFKDLMLKNIELDYLLLNVENELLSITNKNKISINNSDEDYLIRFTGELIDAIS